MSEVRFDWAEANTQHIALHGISPVEVEQCVLDENAILVEIQSVRGEERFVLTGMTPSGRFLVVVFTLVETAIRPVTSYPATRMQQIEYLKQWQG